MSVETVTYISDLDYTQPLAADPRKQGDDHLRNIKLALRQTFPNVAGPVTATHTQINAALALSIISASGYSTLQAAIDANPGKAIYAPEGSYAPFVVDDDNTRIYGAGPAKTYIITTSLTGHGVKFYPNDTTSTTSFLDNCGISDLTIYSGADKTAGAGLYLLQCSGFRLHNVQIQNHPEGLLVSGGQLNVFDGLTVYASASILTGTPVSNSQGIYLREAPIDGGLYQGCFTCEFTNTIMALSRCLDKGLRVGSSDGAHFTNGYWSGAYSDEVYIECVTAGEYVAGLEFNSIYLDGILNTAAPTNRNGINIPASALGTVFSVKVRGGQIANYTGKGCVIGEQVYRVGFYGVEFLNTDNWGIDVVGSNTVTDIVIQGCQFDSVGDITNSTGAVSLSTVVSAVVTGNSFTNINDTGATAIYLTGTNVNGQFENNSFYNCTNNITNAATWTGTICGVPVTWTPALSFATAGDSSFTYSVQFGEYIRHGSTVKIDFNLTTSAFTHTTASGNLQISLPIQVKTLSNYGAHCPVLWSGITKANYTQMTARALTGATVMTVVASGSGQAAAAIAASDMPTGGSVIMRGTMTYEVAA